MTSSFFEHISQSRTEKTSLQSEAKSTTLLLQLTVTLCFFTDGGNSRYFFAKLITVMGKSQHTLSEEERCKCLKRSIVGVCVCVCASWAKMQRSETLISFFSLILSVISLLISHLSLSLFLASCTGTTPVEYKALAG